MPFGAEWQPNGSTSREGALLLGFGTTAFLLVIFYLYDRMLRRAQCGGLEFVEVAGRRFYVALGSVDYLNRWIVERSRDGQRPAAVSEWMVSRELDAGIGVAQELKPAMVVAAKGRARSRALPEPIPKAARKVRTLSL